MIKFNVTGEPDQQFSAVVDGRRLTLRLWYSTFTERWSLDVSVDGEPVVAGRKIVTGVDLIEPFSLKIGVIFAATSDESGVVDRDAFTDGTASLYHATESEVNAAISA